MKKFERQILLASTIYLGCLANINLAQAQVTSDGTVPTNVNQSGNVFEITGGGQADANLFHSFQEFSVPTGNTAFFNNAASIANIISRVTGGSISNIDGLIKANGSANFILINPQGISFGDGARLDIGGSFLGSTANSLTFADGTQFSATNPQNPLLTVSVPLGLQMGQNPEPIRVQGTGHNFTVADPVFAPVTRGNNPSGLSVKAGNTLALVGGNINLEGGILTAEGGRVELGSVSSGLVRLESVSQGWKLGYNDVSSFQDIELRSSSLADASGINGGSIQVQGKNLSVENGSLILIQNQGFQTAGTITLNASESLTVSGSNQDGSFRTSVNNQTLDTGPGGNIEIFTGQLVVDGGASIVATTFGSGAGGNINVDASESVQMLGANPLIPRAISSISSATLSSGNAGNTTVSTKRLNATGGGIIASSTLGTGNGGNLNVTATESIDLVGVEPNLFTPSALTVASLNAGNTGNLTVNTSRLTISDGGRVDASALATGNSGSLTINASEFVEVKGIVPQSVNPSLISSAANEVDASLQQAFNLPALPSGNAGNMTINTPLLKIDNGAQVTVRNDGSGDAGTLEVNANNIFLSNQGGISAVTKQGKGGNINLQVQNSLQMGGFSQISSDNFAGGDSGDLTIETGELRIGDGAFISAVTFGEGKGANVTIRATDSVEITGIDFQEFQTTFQAGALSGSLLPNTRGTGIFLGTGGTGASGNLTMETPSLLMNDGAVIFNPTFSEGIGGNISIRASESVELIGSAVQTGTTPGSTGAAGKIEIDTGKLILRDGATIINPTFGDGAGGNVEINALQSVELRNTPPGALLLTGIYTNTAVGSGAGGDIRIDTAKLSIRDGVIGSNTGASLPTGVIPLGGPGGNVVVNASESIEIAGIQADTRFPSGLGTTGFSQSPSGDVTISTKKLLVSEGADISTAALGAGQGGNLTINASESIELIGTTVGDITLGGLSAASGRTNLPELEATGASGNIKVTTKNLVVRDGASIDVQSLGSGDAGNLDVVADSILLNNQGSISANSRGIGSTGNVSISARSILLDNDASISAESGGRIPGIFSPQTRANANNGDINISTQQLVLRGGAGISTATFTDIKGGNINVNASDSVQVIGASPVDPGSLSLIATSTFSAADSGNVTVSTGRLSILGGGRVAAGTFGSGDGGDVIVNAAESVEILGAEPSQLVGSLLGASTLNAGDGGNLTVNTANLVVRDGGRVDSSTAATGSAGSVTINASESVEISGTVPGTLTPSLVSTGANIENEIVQRIFGLPPVPSGVSGDLTINTGRLTVTDGAQVSARNEGSGNAGNLQVNADSIFLNNQGSISAATTAGEGGNIDLQIQNSLQMQGSSQISSDNFGTGDSGNINITARSVSLRDGSSLTTDSQGEGNAGTINITASEDVVFANESKATSQIQEGAVGNAGNINITGRSISLLDDSELSTDSQGKGDAGNITLTATEDVVVANESDVESRVRGGIGNAGEINITAGSVTVTNDSEVESDNRDGVGNAGVINIAAKSVLVNNGSDLRVSSESQGNAGTININASETVTFDNNGDAESRVRPGGVGNGGNVNINTGSLLVTRGGNIRTSSFGQGNAGDVNITATNEIVIDGFGLDQLGEITLSGIFSSLDSEAVGNAGSINIKTGALSVTNSGQLSVLAAGAGDAGTLSVNADSILLDNQGTISANSRGIGNTGNLNLTARSIVLNNEASITAELGGDLPAVLNQGSSPANSQLSGTFSPQTRGNARGGDINISTQRLIIQGGAEISTANFTDRTGGNLNVDASESVQVIGVSPANPDVFSFIGASTSGSGDSGDVIVSTGRLAILDGGIFNAGTFGSGNGGDITLNVTELVELSNNQPATNDLPTGLLANSFDTGNAGNLTINTKNLTIKDGSIISVGTLTEGKGGNITINASESISISGMSGSSPSSIVANTLGQGDGGDIKITTDNLSISNGGLISASSERPESFPERVLLDAGNFTLPLFATGNAGNVEIKASSINLDGGSISSATSAGEGGNISLQSNSLLMRRNSDISATAGGTGNGGNILITGSSPADFVVLLEGSKISANAFEGMGGNIQIDTKALFVCGDCEITASSQLGVEGLVTINRLQPNTELQVINVPQRVAESEEVVALACSTTEEEDQSEFIITGRGGLPPRPTEPLSSENLVGFDSSSDLNSPSVSQNLSEESDTAKLPAPARGWYLNSQGILILAAQTPSALPYSSGLTTPKCHDN